MFITFYKLQKSELNYILHSKKVQCLFLISINLPTWRKHDYPNNGRFLR